MAPDAPMFSPFELGGVVLRNRFIRSATFEGMCPGGVPSPALTELHRRAAAGGVAMTTVAYCSVSADGRTYDTQMWMREAIVPQLTELTAAVHGEGAAASVQIGHSGYFAERDVIGCRPLGPSRLFNLYGLATCQEMTRADMERVADDFARTASMARRAGFDAVEVHAGHGYLLSQFLSPYTNRRTDGFGGSLTGRLRFPLMVLGRVREAVGPDYPVLVKTNLRDGFPGGLAPPESVLVARAFEQGGASALVLSGGFVTRTPLYMLRGDVPVMDMVRGQSSLLRKAGLLLFGRIFVPHHPYRPLFFLRDASRVRAAVKLPLVYVGGVRTLDEVAKVMDEGFELVAMARALVREPDLIARMQSGRARAARCVPCNRCIAEMDRGHLRCPLEP